MPTDTFDIAVDADDGGAHYTSGATNWSDVTAGVFATDDGTFCSVAQSFTPGPVWFLYNCFFRWDTSSLPDDATITAAVLRLELLDKGDPQGVSVAGDYYDFGGEPSVTGDMEISSSGDAISSTAYASLSIGLVDLVITNFTGISLTGYTGIRLAPATTTTPTGDNYLQFASREHATGAVPQLRVTWTAAAVDSRIAWVVA